MALSMTVCSFMAILESPLYALMKSYIVQYNDESNSPIILLI